MTDAPRPPLPPFTPETAAQKVRAAEDGWKRALAWFKTHGVV